MEPPFGLDAVQTKNKFHFTGEPGDPGTGLLFLRARYYDPAASRFLSVDPQQGTALTPRSLHRDSYALDNPQRFIDPSGQTPELPGIVTAVSTPDSDEIAIMAQQWNSSMQSSRRDPGVTGLQPPPDCLGVRDYASPNPREPHVVRDDQKPPQEHLQARSLLRTPTVLLCPGEKLGHTLETQGEYPPFQVRLIQPPFPGFPLPGMQQAGNTGVEKHRRHRGATFAPPDRAGPVAPKSGRRGDDPDRRPPARGCPLHLDLRPE